MKNVTNRAAVLFGYLPDFFQRLRQLCSQHATIIYQIIWREIAESKEKIAVHMMSTIQLENLAKYSHLLKLREVMK